MRRLPAVAMALLLGGCVAHGPGSTPGPRVSSGQSQAPAAQASPSGALYGRVMHQDGSAAPEAAVTMTQMTTEEFIAAAFSLGIFCLLPGPICRAEAAKVDSGGRYSFRPEQMKKDDHISITAVLSPLDGQVVGPRVSAQLKDGKDPQHVPDLQFWEPKIDIARDGTRLKLSWPARSGAKYSVHAAPADGMHKGQLEIELAKGLTKPTTTVDMRVFEDTPMVLVVVADSGALQHSSPGQPVPSGEVPPSRGKGCLLDGKTAIAPCVLTDGDLDSHAEALVAGECSVNDRSCKGQGHRRFCVDLGSARKISLVVVRTPFPRSDARIELSTDGRTWQRAGVWGKTDTSAVPISPARSARYACAVLAAPISGYQLTEISVWS